MASPSILYKYLPPSRIDVLLRKRIRFSPPEDLNDPFESRPVIHADPQSTEEATLSELGDEDLAEKKARWWDDRAHRRGTEIVWNKVNELFGVLSLSEDPVQPVMWAHYASNSSGFLIGFDTTHEWFQGEDADGQPSDGPPTGTIRAGPPGTPGRTRRSYLSERSYGHHHPSEEQVLGVREGVALH